MKFQVASATLFSIISAVTGQYDTVIPGPVCAKFNTIKVEGEGKFVDTDGSGVGTSFPLTEGDMSVTFSLTGVAASGSYPNQSVFRSIDLDMNAVCVVKKDQLMPPFDAPVCFYEAEMSFCRNWLIFLDDIKVEKISAEKVIEPEVILAALSKLDNDGGRRTRSVRGGEAKVDVNAEPVVAPENRELQIFKRNRVDLDETVEAVIVDKEVYALNERLFQEICPALGCYVPFSLCRDTRNGGFTAHGTGSQNIKITGGTAGLFGAFGQIITPDSGIVIDNINPTTGDIDYNFDMDLEICYYRREVGFWF